MPGREKRRAAGGQTPGGGPGQSGVRRLVLAGLLGALLAAGQLAMSGLPNISLTDFLIVLYTLEFPREAPWAVAVFILLEGLLYGFGLWWVMYLYVWYILMAAAFLLGRLGVDSAPAFAAACGGFGLAFGALCSLPYLALGGPAAAFGWWVAGIRFDLLHCAGNTVLTLLLYRPARRALAAARNNGLFY